MPYNKTKKVTKNNTPSEVSTFVAFLHALHVLCIYYQIAGFMSMLYNMKHEQQDYISICKC